jgi:hypothetical protein
MATEWQKLILRFADGRQPCNCGNAYYNAEGRCAYGCSANAIEAREEIARRIEAEAQKTRRVNSR